MTITITIEELRQYQDAVTAWAEVALVSAAVIKAAQTINAGDTQSDSWRRLSNLQSQAKKWIAENPMPKFVPKEMEA